MATPSAQVRNERRELASKARVLHLRQTLLQAIRTFFSGEGFLEVETPVRIPVPALEDHIDAEPSGDHFLRTSPELRMKRLLAAGYERVFQIGPCFRQGERGHQHLPEFTMLEWYRTGADTDDVLADMIELLRGAARAATGGTRFVFRGQTVDVGGEWEQVTVAAAFRRYAGREMEDAVRSGSFEEALVEQVEPRLGRGRPTILRDYPFTGGGLARTRPDAPDLLDRWELYIGGLELANACGELTDGREQRRRFAATSRLREALGRPLYATDEAFLAALDSGMPAAAGVALGVDRLTLLLADADGIDQVVPFPEA